MMPSEYGHEEPMFSKTTEYYHAVWSSIRFTRESGGLQASINTIPRLLSDWPTDRDN